MKCSERTKILLAIVSILIICSISVTTLTGCAKAGQNSDAQTGTAEDIAREDGFGSEMTFGTLINEIQ